MEHFLRGTVEASAWCRKSGKATMHRVDGVKLGPCLVCLARLDAAVGEATECPPCARQEELFG